MGQINPKIIVSDKYDPWFNLSLEEGLLREAKPGDAILYLWQNQNTVVIGRNQNAWKECRWKELEEADGKLARRLSGGGAVFHDLGNLNFTFVMDKELYNLEKQLEVILNAVRSFGVDAEFSGRNDILAEGQKFSGNAFYSSNNASFHHGTLLVNVDFAKLGKYLNVSQDKMKTKGVKSVQARVVNLATLNNAITIESISSAMKESFQNSYGSAEIIHRDQVDSDMDELYKRYESWEWRYGQTPEFDVTYETRFEWGGIEMGFSLKDGRVEACKIYSDAMDSDLIPAMAESLKGIPFKFEDIKSSLMSVSVNQDSTAIIDELLSWLREKQL